ncbi:MAG TPA: hypothetical protein VK742_21185 [Candidatus Sulfotelmatobacter sp.]|jgi:hypothetical protein|nr:hypothetical protein [Candidatus Sulfotelmatobacter sp.]
MSGKTNGLTALEMRKQLLIVESELNRAHLDHDLQTVMVRVHHVAGQISALGSLASTVSSLGPSVADFFSGISGPDKEAPSSKETSWFSRLFSGVRAGVDLWTAIRSDRR